MTRKNRQRVARLATALILFAVLPLYVLRLVGLMVVRFADWCAEGRRWSKKVIATLNRLELWSAQ